MAKRPPPHPPRVPTVEEVFFHAMQVLGATYWAVPKPVLTELERCRPGATDVPPEVGMRLVDELTRLRARADKQYADWIARFTEAITPRVRVCRTCGRPTERNITPKREWLIVLPEDLEGLRHP